MKSEPVLIIAGGLGVLISTGLGLLFAFVTLTPAQYGAITAFAGAVTALAAALLARGQAYSPLTVETQFFPKTVPAPPDGE